MRNKKAKALRRMAKAIVRKNSPNEIVERQLIYSEKVTAKNQFHVPVINSPTSVRGVYLKLKRMKNRNARRTC